MVIDLFGALCYVCVLFHRLFSLSLSLLHDDGILPFCAIQFEEKGEKERKNVFPTLLMSLTTPENVSFLKGADTCRLWAIL
jgi:hypothetical protein